MTPEPRWPPLDLLVVGGMTIDRFADGSWAPGGSVVHVAGAAFRHGLRLGVITSAGREPEAARGLAMLRQRADHLTASRHPSTATFVHREGPGGRKLWLAQAGGPVRLAPGAAAATETRAILFAPVMAEIPADALDRWAGTALRAGILQGWLRAATRGDVTPLPLAALDPVLAAALSGFDLLVASREDLIAEAAAPQDQLSVLRTFFGPEPTLVVTDGTGGLWLDAEVTRSHLPAPRTVEGVSTVGAGDILAAFLAAPASDASGSWRARAEDAMRVVAHELEARNRD